MDPLFESAVEEYKGGQLEYRVLADLAAVPDEPTVSAILVGVMDGCPQGRRVGLDDRFRLSQEMEAAARAVASGNRADVVELASDIAKTEVRTMVMLLRIRDGEASQIVLCRHPDLDDEDAAGCLAWYLKTLDKERAPSA